MSGTSEAHNGKIKPWLWVILWSFIGFGLIVLLAVIDELYGGIPIWLELVLVSSYIISGIIYIDKNKEYFAEISKKRIYDVELIKERARLQAQKEYKQHEKK